MTIHITLTDDDLKALERAAGQPGRHQVVRQRAQLLVLMDAGHRMATAARTVGRSYQWAAGVVHAYQEGGAAAVLSPHSYETQRRGMVHGTGRSRGQPESREAFVARMCRRGKSLRDIGKMLGVTPERVRQIRNRAAGEGYQVT